MSTSFYRGAQGVLLVYDISSRASFEAMDKWFEEALDYTRDKTVLYLVRLPSPPSSRLIC